jgi:hypothetical protein
MRCATITDMRPVALSLFFALTTFAGPPLSQGERDRAMSHMHATRKLFLDATANLTPEQWSFKAAPEKWSIAECAEHIAASETFLWGLIEKLAAAPASKPEEIEKTKGKDATVVKMVPDRTSKFQAPEPIKPKKLAADPTEYLAKFKAARDEHIAYIEKTDASLRDKVMPHPAMGPLDAYQWALLLSAHAERHVLQIQEVKAAPGFPASSK